MTCRISKDVEILKNRVRMLEMEEKRAMKKIQETKKKTNQIKDLKKRNDDTFMNVGVAINSPENEDAVRRRRRHQGPAEQ